MGLRAKRGPVLLLRGEVVDERSPSVASVRESLRSASGRELARLLARLESDVRPGVVSACATARKRLSAQNAESHRISRLYEIERGLRDEGFSVIAGLDEVGRGALAGPLTVGAVILPADPKIEGLDDSKKLRRDHRREVASRVREVAMAFSIVHIDSSTVDSLGISAALRRAFAQAVALLPIEPDRVLLDGLPLGITETEMAFVKGDSRVAAIAAASVVAKVARDDLMIEMAAQHPQYGFEINKGYGTPEHMAAISEHGLCEIHRRSFSFGGGTASLF